MTWFDTISKIKGKGMRKLEDALLLEGYKIVETGSGKKHTKIKVKRLSEVDDPNAEVVQTTVSHTTASGRFNPAMVVREIINKFTGRRRRGQGSFKLSNDKINTWQSILKIEPKDNPLSDEFEPPEIPPINRREYTTLGNFDYSKYIPKSQAKVILSKFPIAKKLFEIRDGEFWKKILRIEGDYWIYDNSYMALEFDTKRVKSIINEHDLKSTIRDVDLFLDAILKFFLTIDSNYEERTEAIEIYAPTIHQFIVKEYKGQSKEKEIIEGTVSEAMEILESFEGKVKPIEIVIQETIDDIAEGDTEINWEVYSEFFDTDNFDLYENEEQTSPEGMVEEDYEESRTEEELRRRRNRG